MRVEIRQLMMSQMIWICVVCNSTIFIFSSPRRSPGSAIILPLASALALAAAAFAKS